MSFHRALSKGDVRVAVEDGVVVQDRVPGCPPEVYRGLELLEAYVIERRYEDYDVSEILKNPRTTDRGILYALGTFAGPSPNDGEERDPLDFAEYRFILVEDKDTPGVFTIEIYYDESKINTLKIEDNSLEVLSGELPAIT